MKEHVYRRTICCLVAVIMLFLGISAEASAIDSSFLRASNVKSATSASINAIDNIAQSEPACTIAMLQNGLNALRACVNGGFGRGQIRMASMFLMVANFLQFLVYQETEGKEDGQLFLCRSVVVDYIHQKDNGK